MRTCLILTLGMLLGTGLTAGAENQPVYTPRNPLPKKPESSLVIPRNKEGKSTWNGRLVVKFTDQVKGRARADGRGFKSLANSNLASADAILAKYGLRVKQVLNRTEDEIETVRVRARDNSFREQPDLAGMVFVTGKNEADLVKAARELNALDTVEFVQFEQEYIYHQCGMGGACNVEAMTPGCADDNCCGLIGAINPLCVDPNVGMWDSFCVELANIFCQGDDYDRCKAPTINGGCFDVHPTPGCRDETCCNDICDAIPLCCVVSWDQNCVTAACSLCGVAGGAAPDFTEDNPANFLQKYRTPEPVGAGSAFFDLTGFNGRGLDLPIMHAFAQQLIDDYGVGTEDLTFGKGANIGIVEHTAYLNHEDLVNKVIKEPGQTVVEIEQGVLSPNHGTATLGECVAENNGFGVTGIAWQAQGYFFPIVSIEEGGRTLNAMFSAISTFQPGDVLNYSIGPGGGGTLVSQEAEWVLVRTGSDLGITSCISAGNSCVNLDDAGQFGDQDSGAIIVGAGWSGGPFDPATDPPPPFGSAFCRLGFSNYCQTCDPEVGLVHIQAWGHNVCTTGYGDLVGACEGDPNKTYSAEFSGTSSAAPIISGTVACLQGLAKQIYGIPLQPEQIRTALTSGAIPQCELQTPPGSQTPCAGDFDFASAPNLIGGFPDLAEASATVLSGTWFDGSAASAVTIHTGTYLGGSYLSLRSDDANYFKVTSKKARIGDKVSGLVYLATGATTDIEVEFKVVIAPEDAVDMSVITNLSTTAPVAIQVVYAFNYTKSRWTLLGVGVVQSGADPNNPDEFLIDSDGNFAVATPPDFIKNNSIRVRVYCAGLGASSVGMVTNYDLVDVDVANQDGVIVAP